MIQIKRINLDKKVILFFAVGLGNTLIGLSLFPVVYWLCVDYRAHYVVMLVVCHVCAVLTSYMTNKRIVFRTSGNYSIEMGKFFLFHLTYLLVIIYAIPMLVDFSHLSPVIIQMSITVLSAVCSYFWYDRVVYT